MAKNKDVQSAIKDMEYNIAKYKAVLKEFPDATICDTYFKSKLVNKKYSKLEFEVFYDTLRVKPYCELEFEYDNKKETIIIASNPRCNRLAYIHRSYKSEGGVSRAKFILSKSIRFAKLAINLKTHQFKENMLNECRVQIMDFIKNNPGYKLNTKFLDPHLKKLLLFI